MNVVIIKTFQGVTMELARVVPHLLYWFFSRNGDDKLGYRDLLKRDKPAQIAYGTLLPSFMMSMLIGNLFQILCPAILWFNLIFFGFSYVVYKHNFMYVYAHTSESGGALFFPMYERTIGGMIIGQLLVAGYMFIRLAVPQAIVALALPALTYVAGNTLKYRYQKAASNLSYENAVYLDEKFDAEKLDHFSSENFSQPALKHFEPLFPKQSSNDVPEKATV
eukprot:scaffold69_cov248-Pinguiococcus_pyrenoidosus.AAC.37